MSNFALRFAGIMTCLGLFASAADMFPGQPRLSMAYSKVTATITELTKAAKEPNQSHFDKAVGWLGEARTQLELTPRDKGSAPGSAIKLIDEVTQILSAKSVAKEDISKATEACKEILKKIGQASRAAR
jgi:hypothetical protein